LGTIEGKGTVPVDRTSEALFGKTRRGVLALLFGRPDESFYLREIIRQTGGGAGAVQRELAHLHRAGLIERLPRGSQVHYRANSVSPVFPELRALVAKTTGAADVLRAALGPLSEAGAIQFAFVYGSMAKGEQGPDSDIDLMVIGDVGFADLVQSLQSAQRVLGREINPTIYTVADYRAGLAGRAHFLTSVVRRPKLMLVGRSDELEGLGS
jgi:uncharacterized protein